MLEAQNDQLKRIKGGIDVEKVFLQKQLDLKSREIENLSVMVLFRGFFLCSCAARFKIIERNMSNW